MCVRHTQLGGSTGLASGGSEGWLGRSFRSRARALLAYPSIVVINRRQESEPSRGVKGSHVLQVSHWVNKHLGPDSFARLANEAAERRRDTTSWNIVLPISWYDVHVVRDALDVACERVGVPLEEAQTEIAKMNALQDLKSIYRFFMRMSQPQRILTQTPRMWRTYVNFAEASVVQNEPGFYVGQCAGFDEELVPWVSGCWAGFIPTLVEIAGGHDIHYAFPKRWPNERGSYSLHFELHYS